MQKMDIGHDAVVYGLMIDEQTNGKVSYALKSFNIKRGQADIIVYGASNYQFSSFGQYETFVIDLSKSYDPDYPDEELFFNWTCPQRISAKVCDQIFGHNTKPITLTKSMRDVYQMNQIGFNEYFYVFAYTARRQAR